MDDVKKVSVPGLKSPVYDMGEVAASSPRVFVVADKIATSALGMGHSTELTVSAAVKALGGPFPNVAANPLAIVPGVGFVLNPGFAAQCPEIADKAETKLAPFMTAAAEAKSAAVYNAVTARTDASPAAPGRPDLSAMVFVPAPRFDWDVKNGEVSLVRDTKGALVPSDLGSRLSTGFNTKPVFTNLVPPMLTPNGQGLQGGYLIQKADIAANPKLAAAVENLLSPETLQAVELSQTAYLDRDQHLQGSRKTTPLNIQVTDHLSKRAQEALLKNLVQSNSYRDDGVPGRNGRPRAEHAIDDGFFFRYSQALVGENGALGRLEGARDKAEQDFQSYKAGMMRNVDGVPSRELSAQFEQRRRDLGLERSVENKTVNGRNLTQVYPSYAEKINGVKAMHGVLVEAFQQRIAEGRHPALEGKSWEGYLRENIDRVNQQRADFQARQSGRQGQSQGTQRAADAVR